MGDWNHTRIKVLITIALVFDKSFERKSWKCSRHTKDFFFYIESHCGFPFLILLKIIFAKNDNLVIKVLLQRRKEKKVFLWRCYAGMPNVNLPNDKQPKSPQFWYNVEFYGWAIFSCYATCVSSLKHPHCAWTDPIKLFVVYLLTHFHKIAHLKISNILICS